MPDSPSSPSWEQRQRFRLIEALAIAAGGVRLADLRDHFDLSTRRASQDLRAYAKLCPGNLLQDAETGVLRPSDHFQPRFMPSRARDWLPLLERLALAEGLDHHLSALLPGAFETLEPPTRDFDIGVLHRCITAIRERRQLRLVYQSMSSPQPRSLLLEPHVLVDVGRWHMRAWSDTHQGWRDFLLSRVRGLPELGARAGSDPAADWDWQHPLIVRIGAHPGLSPAQREVVEHDYAMTHGVAERPVRLALAPYLLRMLGVGRGDRERAAAEQQIVLLNPELLDSLDRLGSRP